MLKYISRFIARSWPFFKTLKGAKATNTAAS
jgi:hypothetical protein